ncbi:hypothetical protein H1C71_014405 [Ictidomys tridecemlineatus]|nr:hypothetical protein H1C71_014405 [Ictidomys tridecemlineatus]
MKHRVKSPGGPGSHVRQKAVRRPSSVYSTGDKRKENPIEDELVFRVGSRGREKGEFTNLQGVSAASSGRIVVADSNNQCLQTKTGAGCLMGPKGVAVDRNGHIIVVDNKSCCVFTFQPNGKLIGHFGGCGATDRHFAGPHFVAVNNKNEIVVTDFHNHSVKVLMESSSSSLAPMVRATGSSTLPQE